MNRPKLQFAAANTICSAVTDGTHDSPKQVESGKPLITSKHIQNRHIDFENAYQISVDDFTAINKRSQVYQWDVIISMIGEHCGYCYVERNEEIDYAIKNVGVFRAGNQLHAEWIYYYLNSSIGKAHLNKIRGGSSQPYLSLGGLRSLPILVPPSDESKEFIVNVLSTLDAKIDLNRRINAELEAMAKLLYDYWFVQFDFPISAAQATAMGRPDLKGKPYRASGGKMVYNEKLKREIPEGWGGGNILAVSRLGGGATPSKERTDFWDGNIPFFTPTDAKAEPFCLDTEDHITELGLQNSATRIYEKGTVFITARGSVGKAMIISSSMAMNQSCYALNPIDGISPPFLYFHVLSLMDYLRTKSSGSIFKSIVTNDITFTPAVGPPQEVVTRFSKVAVPVFEQILVNQKQTQHLTQLRDWLLPMLMNGQVTVGDSANEPTSTQDV